MYVAPGKRVGSISQIPVYPPDYTTEDALAAHARLDRISARMKELEKEMAEDRRRISSLPSMIRCWHASRLTAATMPTPT